MLFELTEPLGGSQVFREKVVGLVLSELLIRDALVELGPGADVVDGCHLQERRAVDVERRHHVARLCAQDPRAHFVLNQEEHVVVAAREIEGVLHYVL